LGPRSNPTKFTPSILGIKIFLLILLVSFNVCSILGLTLLTQLGTEEVFSPSKGLICLSFSEMASNSLGFLERGSGFGVELEVITG